MITPIVLKPANAGRTKVVIIHHGIYCIFPLVIVTASGVFYFSARGVIFLAR